MNQLSTSLVSHAESTDSSVGKNGAAISRGLWPWVRLGGGAAILAVLIGRLGAGPFVDALRLTSAWSLGSAVAITALTTVCCAWRWSLVAGGLGVGVRLSTAVAAYYRSQFLNATLPSGVLGDVHRGVRHGRDVDQMGRSLRSVAWERILGQAVQIVLAGIVLLLLPSPVRSSVPVVAAVIGTAGLGVVVIARATSRGTPRLPARIIRGVVDDLRNVLVVRRAWPGVVLTSGVAAMGHVVIFLVAVRATGATAPAGQLLPLALIVLLASAIPTSIAGWGPREGAAAWAFSSAGLTAEQGVTIAVVYGVMVLVATLPGAVVLVVGRRRGAGTSRPTEPVLEATGRA